MAMKMSNRLKNYKKTGEDNYEKLFKTNNYDKR